jgi:hypothetical protein
MRGLKEALIGRNLARRFRITFDHGRQVLNLKPFGDAVCQTALVLHGEMVFGFPRFGCALVQIIGFPFGVDMSDGHRNVPLCYLPARTFSRS